MEAELFRIYIGSPRKGFISAADNAKMDEIIAVYFTQWITTDATRGYMRTWDDHDTEQLKVYAVCSADQQRTAPANALGACMNELGSAFPDAFLMVERKNVITEVRVEKPLGSVGVSL